jgi:hypothetical protein
MEPLLNTHTTYDPKLLVCPRLHVSVPSKPAHTDANLV